MKKIPIALTVIGIVFILSGGGAYTLLSMIFMDYGHLAVPVAVVLAAIGATVLTINSIIYPESIKRPDIQPPQINLPPNIGIRYKPQISYVVNAVKDMVSIDEQNENQVSNGRN